MGRNSLDLTKKQLEEKLREHKTQSLTAKALGISQGSVSNYVREFGIESKMIRKTPDVEHHKMPMFTMDKLETYLYSLQETEAPSIGYEEVSIDIETETPILIIPLADWHLGARWVDYKSLLETIKFIKNTPNVYTVLNGDYCDNYNTSAYKGGQVEERIPIQIQKAAAETLIKELAPKTFTIINGCHDEWSFFNDGFDFGKYLADKGNVYYLGHWGFINLSVGNIEYRIFVIHKTFRNSSYNDGHGIRIALKEHGDFDIGISAHHHKPFVETFSLKGETKWITRCNAFKGQDRHGSKMAFPPILHTIPGMILDNTSKNVILDINYKNLVSLL